MPQPHFFNPWIIVSELIFTLIAVAFCFRFYLKTKESFDLTKHEGIRFFRDMFLFFGLSYALRFVFGLILASKVAFDIFIPRHLLMPVFILPLSYVSTMAILFMLLSSTWKRFENKHLLVICHAVAIVLSIVAFLTRSPLVLLVLQSILLLIAVIAGLAFTKSHKKFSQVRVLYLLTAGLWLINLWVIDSRHPFPPGVDMFFQLICVGVFILIDRKVSKWVR